MNGAPASAPDREFEPAPSGAVPPEAVPPGAGRPDRAPSGSAPAEPGPPGGAPPESGASAAAVPRLDAALERVLLRFRLRARRRVLWLRELWADEAPAAEGAVGHAEIDGILADRDRPEAEAAWIAGNAEAAALTERIERVEAELAADDRSPLARLCRIFGVEGKDRDVLHGALAIALDPSLARACAYLHDHAGRAYLSEGVAARLFGHGRTGVWHAGSVLRRWSLVEERFVSAADPPALVVDPLVRDWAGGVPALDPELELAADPRLPAPPLAGWPVAETAERIRAALAGGDPAPVRVQVVAPAGWGRRTFAAAVAAELGLPLLAIHADRIAAHEWERVHLRAERQAYIEGAALAWVGERISSLPWPRAVPPFPVQFLALLPGERPPHEPDRIEIRVELPDPTAAERRELWLRFLPAARAWPAPELDRLAARFRVGAGRIAAAARTHPPSADEAAVELRRATRGWLGDLAQWLECPFTWDDLVVPDRIRRALEDLVYEAEARLAIWEDPARRRLFPQGRGLLALFSGAPGTGKTMAAQVVAAALGFDLFRVDLSAVISKYVGETSQNLQRVLSRAPDDAVLLFDEADTLFGKRTEIRDAHDRFANADTNHLLQAVEEYRGIAVLATNRKDNVDPAFVRRLRFVVEFPRPDAQHRRRLWRDLVGALAGREARIPDGQLDTLAATLDLTGAQIKSAVLAGLFRARRLGEPLSVRHLLEGVDRELMKEGRALSERERERLGKIGRG